LGIAEMSFGMDKLFLQFLIPPGNKTSGTQRLIGYRLNSLKTLGDNTDNC